MPMSVVAKVPYCGLYCWDLDRGRTRVTEGYVPHRFGTPEIDELEAVERTYAHTDYWAINPH